MISSLVSVPRGAARQRPKLDVIDAAEVDQLRQNMPSDDMQAVDDEEDEEDEDEEQEVRAAVRLRPHQPPSLASQAYHPCRPFKPLITLFDIVGSTCEGSGCVYERQPLWRGSRHAVRR